MSDPQRPPILQPYPGQWIFVCGDVDCPWTHQANKERNARERAEVAYAQHWKDRHTPRRVHV